MTNRDRPASTQTKREKAAERYAELLLARAGIDYRLDDLAAEAVALADALYDELDTPTELRGFMFPIGASGSYEDEEATDDRP